MRRRLRATALALTMLITNSAVGQPGFDTAEAAKNGWSMEQNRSAGWFFAQHKRLNAAIATLRPQRAGIVDVYVISIALDSDPVFGREAGEAAKVLSRRYSAAGRNIVLAAGADGKATGNPQGSPPNLAAALAAVADRMDVEEDVLVLFATTHGDPVSGLAYRNGDSGAGMIAPQQLANLLDRSGFRRRMILLSACYSGIFIPSLTRDDSIIVTAASFDRTSFGCEPGNDWTFFGDALINNALRKPQPFDKATDEAISLIGKWETGLSLVPSQPQVVVGSKARRWLTPLETKMPKVETAKVGRPAVKRG